MSSGGVSGLLIYWLINGIIRVNNTNKTRTQFGEKINYFMNLVQFSQSW